MQYSNTTEVKSQRDFDIKAIPIVAMVTWFI